MNLAYKWKMDRNNSGERDRQRRPDMNSTMPDESSVRELVQRYKICWEVWPECVVNHSHLEKTGYDLELLGTHAEGTDHVNPGCHACVEVYKALRQIAEYILPKDQGLPTRYEIEPFEPALRYCNTRNNRPDVVLDVKIL